MLRELIEYRRFLNRRQWPEERIQSRQRSLLRDIVRHAGSNVTLYRDLFRQRGIDPDAIRDLQDLPKLPVLTKTDLKRSGLGARSADGYAPSGLELVSTSGSTGIPLQIAFARSEGARRRACLMLTYRDLGVTLFHKRLTIRAGLRPAKRTLASAVLSWHRRICSLEDAEEAFRRSKPQVLSGLPTLLHVFALQVRASGSSIRPQLVVPSGEMLFPDTNSLLREVFQAPVRPYYGCWELGIVAAWCEAAQGYHLVSDNVLVECLREGKQVKPGEPGDLTLTGLTSMAMPFIRYNVGDRARLKYDRCECGRSGPTIMEIQGRADDFLVLRDGHLVPPIMCIKPLFDLQFVHQYRVIQETFEDFVVEYSGGRDLTTGELKDIEKHFRKELGAERVQCRHLSEIPSEPSGKLRKIISRVGGAS